LPRRTSASTIWLATCAGFGGAPARDPHRNRSVTVRNRTHFFVAPQNGFLRNSNGVLAASNEERTVTAVDGIERAIRHGLGWRFWCAVSVGVVFAILYIGAGCYFEKVCY
jgi:hypothetical protein